MGKRGKQLKKRRLAEEQASSAEPPEAAVIVDSKEEEDDEEDEEQTVVSETDLTTTIRVLEALSGDLAYFRSKALKRLRTALAPLATALIGEVEGSSKKRQRRPTDSGLSAEEKHRVMDRDALNSRVLRAERLARLEAASNDGEVLAIADGPALQPLVLTDGEEAKKLHTPRSCYVCKSPFRDLHFFYAALCPPCSVLNWSKRDETCSLRGMSALVTGARVKIGFRCALKLLRCGAAVVATTRFPADCASRFAKEQDSAEWRDRLFVIGADFRDLRAVEQLCDFLPSILGDKLHIIVNNACQTVRRPPQYYAPLLERELKLRKSLNTTTKMLENDVCPKEHVADLKQWLVRRDETTLAKVEEELPPGMSLGSTAADPSMRSTLAVAPGDDTVDERAFPEGRTDANADLGQQLDLRTSNSWMLKLEQISTPEAAEVFAINTLAPFVINSRLKPMLSKDADNLKFIVNVSAMEGKFYRHKQPQHPHTNMAKAALNMMTRTSAADYAKSKIYMTAVDTGWINDEKPVNLAKKHADLHDFQTPLDEVDAAARVLDPIIAPMRRLQAGEDPKPPYGIFLKDYTQCEW